jgi:lipopolysaccharide export system protein LptA
MDIGHKVRQPSVRSILRSSFRTAVTSLFVASLLARAPIPFVTVVPLMLVTAVPVAAAEPASAAPRKVNDRKAKDRRAKGDGAPGAGFALPGSQESEPIHIDAERLEFDARENVAVFRGDVVTKQGDVVVHSAVLRVTFEGSQEEQESLGSIERPESVIAEGSVRITQGARTAEGSRAEFNQSDRTLILSGDAVLHEGSSEVRGERVIVFLDEDRSLVEGINSRVKAIFVPDRRRRRAKPKDEATLDEDAEAVPDDSATAAVPTARAVE